MASSKAATVDEYLDQVPEERRDALDMVHRTILDHLPDGYEETMQYGMISYVVPLERYPQTYNDQPLALASLASQKHYMALYLNNVYADPDTAAWFVREYKKTGKRLDMGRSCVRFRSLDDRPLPLVAEVIARTSVDETIARYEASRKGA